MIYINFISRGINKGTYVLGGNYVRIIKLGQQGHLQTLFIIFDACYAIWRGGIVFLVVCLLFLIKLLVVDLVAAINVVAL
jgi:hypothetical protein